MENILKSYYDVSSPGSYGGIERLYRAVKDKGVSREGVKNFLIGQETYQLHKDKRVNFSRNRVISYSKDWNWQVDLVDLSKLSQSNQGYRYVLVAVDVLTKYAWARCMKTKQAGDIKRAFLNIFELDGRKPVRLQSDRGTEFTSHYMKQFFADNDIYFFTTFTKTFKCSVVERLNRTIKSRMFRYFTRNKTRSYVHVMKQIMESYNNSYHRVIKMTPTEASNSDNKTLLRNVYGDIFKKKKENARLKAGDYLRIANDKKAFEKAYEQTFSNLIGRVSNVYKFDSKPLYGIEDLDGSKVKRRFYGKELQLIKKPEIDKIIKNRSGKNLVTFKTYTGEHWVKA